MQRISADLNKGLRTGREGQEQEGRAKGEAGDGGSVGVIKQKHGYLRFLPRLR